jgi:two-component system, cell cycle sensor histidine kinase and response regulator CckA
MLHQLIGEDIELSIRPGKDLGWVKADPGQLQQVVLNLVVNARDAMPRGGRLVLETGNADMDEAASHQLEVMPGEYVRLTVSDSGLGMDETTLARIFEPFFTTKAEGKGTGLGLSIVYGVVKQSGGYIWAYSKPKMGTTLKVYLPRAHEGPRPERDMRAVTEETPGSETVLLVEDDSTLCEVVATILRKAGYTVLVAHSGVDAAALAQKYLSPLDLLLTDIILRGGMNGHELAQILRNMQPSLKVLYISGYADDIIAEHGIPARDLPLIEKPFDSRSLRRKVREILDASYEENSSTQTHQD